MDLRALIRTIPDHPRPGILFRDITTLLADAAGLRFTVETLAADHADLGIAIVAGVEARGFVFGAPLAVALGAGFVPVRKRGRLPAAVIGIDYALEYGTDRVELHADAVSPGTRVLLVDDLIATGGTALAAARLLRQAGAVIAGCAFVVELPDLGGRDRLEAEGLPVRSLVRFEGH